MQVKKCALWQTLLIAIILVKSSFVNPAEIQSFGYLGYEGRLNLDFLYEKNVTGIENKESYDDIRKINRGNLDLLFHTFIYHPNFLKFDFGIGVVYTDASNKTQEVREDPANPGSYNPQEPVKLSDDDTSLNYNFNLSFFEKKDYPFSIFYSLEHPPLSAAVVDAFISENTRYGAKFLWNAPIVLNLDVLHFDSTGSSNLRIIDEAVDTTSFRAFKSLKNSGYHQLNFNHAVTNSNSGSQLEPIIPFTNTSDILNYESMYKFGDSDKYELYLRADLQSERDSFEYDEYGANTDFQWTHNSYLRSYYQYGYAKTQYADNYDVTNDFVRSGLSYSDEGSLTNTTGIVAERSSFTNSESRHFEVRNTSGYNTTFRGGSFTINGSLAVSQNESLSDESRQLIRENITLIENKYVYFTQDNIYINDEITVTNIRNQLLTEGIHYILLRQNGRVGIQRITGAELKEPALLKNEIVGVTYYFDPNNNRYQTKTGTLSSQVNFLKYFHISVNYSENRLNLLEGTLSESQVISSIRKNYVAGVDFPILTDIILGGFEVRQENIDEDTELNLTTTKNDAKIGYLQFRLLRSTSLYVSREDTTTEIIGAIGDNNDVDKITYHALLKIQASKRTNLSFIYDDSIDVGTIKREYSEAALRFEWQYRRLLVNLTGTAYKDKQETQIRDRTAIRLNLIRTF